MSEVAFIIGNGKSRLAIDLNDLVGKGTIFGCNALYRNFDKYDHLIAIDDRMIQELYDNKVPNVIVPPENEKWELEGYPYTRYRSNAGMNAMLEAIKRNHTILYCLGFDFILDDDISLDNVYKDSKNYEPHTQSNVIDCVNRARYLDWFAGINNDVSFVFVVPEKTNIARFTSPNILGLTIPKFCDKLSTTT